MTTLESLLARPFVAGVGWGLLHSVWEVAAVAVVAAVALRVFRRGSPQSRYLVSCGALALSGALPAATAWLAVPGEDAPARLGRSTVATDVTAPSADPAGDRDPAEGEDPREAMGRPTSGYVPTPGLAERVAPLLPSVVAAWAAGVLVLSIRLVGGWFLVQRLTRTGARPVGGERGEVFERLCRRMAVSRPVRLLESTAVRVPMVIGWLRPVVLMPVSALTGLTADQIVAILAHELAHVRRHDYLLNLVQSVAETFLFYHPAVWWLGRRIREEREHCCDDRAAAVCGDRLVYARALAAMEELRSRPWALAPSAGGTPLLARICRLLGVAPPAGRPAGGLAGVVALAAVVVLGLALVLAPGAAPAQAAVESGTTIAGTVFNPDGNPAAGADLWLIDITLPYSRPVVLGEARSEADGRFRIERRDVKDAGFRMGALILWAHRPGSGMSGARLKRDSSSPEPSEPVRLTLAPTVETAVRVLDPEGGPVAGASVAVIFLNENRSHLPDELAGRLGSTTDAAGRAVLKTAPPEAIEMVRVTTGVHGTQVFHQRGGLKPGTDLRLRPVARVEGHVSSADPASARGLHVYLSTIPRDRRQGEIYGQAEAVTDARGRFTVPALAAGELGVDVPAPEGSLLRALRPAVTAIEEKGRAEIEIPLKRMVSVRGVVREKGTRKPVADVMVRFTSRDVANGNDIPLTRTDAEGRFEALAVPSPRAGLYVNPPPTFLRTMRSTEVNVGEADGQTFPIEVERGAMLRGRVVDEAGEPVPGAIVDGKWQQSGGSAGPGGMRLMMTPTAKATTDARGDFLLEGIHPGAIVSLEARSGDARTEGPVTGQPGAADPVTLRLSTANTVALSGRVVDTSGRPVAGGLVRIRSRSAERNGLAGMDFVRFEGSEPHSDEVRTDPDGRFRTPRQLRRGYGYSAEVQAEGRLSATTPWLLLEPSTEPTLPDLALMGLRTVRGRVLDDRGRPVAGAVVRVTGDAPTPVRVVTDARGQFTLADILETPAFLFVEKPGYRFGWHRFGAEMEGVDVTLVPDDGPPPEPLATLPPALPRAEELVLLHRVFDPYAERVLEQGAKPGRFTVLPILIRVEPARALELIDRDGFADSQTRDGLRSLLARRLIAEEPDDSLAQIEAIGDPSTRSHAAYEAAGNLPDGERARKLDLLGRALIAARAVAEPTERALWFALVGERYFDLGEARRATDLIREAEAIARNLPVTGRGVFARGTVAEELSPIDLPAALELLEGTKGDRDHDGYLGHIAHELAGPDPVESERVLMMMRDVWPNFRDKYAQRVCHRMVAVDPDRAERLAAAMKDHKLKARAYGAMALALAPTDRPAATRLLAEAFGVLARAVEDDKDQWDGLGTAGTAAAGLLPIVEQVDPRLLHEYLGRTLALRPPLRGSDTREGIADLTNAQVAAMVARYDRESARAVFDAFAGMAIARLGGGARWDQSFHAESVFTAAATVDPARAVALVEGLTDASDPSPPALKETARLAVARVLAAEGAQRWREVEWSLLHLWRIDTELY